MPDEKRQTDPRPLSTEYHKAHKQLMLWSAILFIWELVGIDLEKAKEAGGNAGAIIGAIKSPQAVPWALIILIAYFLFKTTVEWFQCSLPRRALRVARTDFATAWLVPLLAIALYAFQAIRKVQFAEVVQRKTFTLTFFGGSSIAIVLVLLIWRSRDFYEAFRDGSLGWDMPALLFYAVALVAGIGLIVADRVLHGVFGWLVLRDAFLIMIVMTTLVMTSVAVVGRAIAAFTLRHKK